MAIISASRRAGLQRGTPELTACACDITPGPKREGAGRRCGSDEIQMSSHTWWSNARLKHLPLRGRFIEDRFQAAEPGVYTCRLCLPLGEFLCGRGSASYALVAAAQRPGRRVNSLSTHRHEWLCPVLSRCFMFITVRDSLWQCLATGS